ncbi:MAG: prolipoprotein diacylglyceryl transferase [Candidatus Eisenbacteria sp.]|nr:prolipoprotein diacylglyceryl transferase [Candidatus Eisenbacteria bacterium]
MHRILVELGPLRIYSYGFMLMVAFAVGIFLAVTRGRRRGILPEFVMDLSTLIVFAAIVGSRMVYVLFHGDGYWPRWWDVFKVWEGGLTVYGGVLLAVVVAYAFCRSRGVPFLKIADTVAPSLALGVGITRIGCFLNGCCYGSACELPWAVRFPQGSLAEYEMGRIGIHPSQLYASFVGFAVFLVLFQVDRRPRREGFVFWLFVFLFSAGTFFTDFTRHWESSAIVLRSGAVVLSVNQLLELGLVVLAVIMLCGRVSGKGGGMEEGHGTA